MGWENLVAKALKKTSGSLHNTLMALKSTTRDSFKWTNGRGHNQKPILYTIKNNVFPHPAYPLITKIKLTILNSVQTLGLGKSLYQAQTDNWWERAFDNSLKSLAVSQSTDGGIRVVQEDVKGVGVGLNQVVELGKGKYVGCINFVKGGSLEGTLSQSSVVPVTRVEEKVVGGEEWSKRRVGKRQRGEKGEESRPEKKEAEGGKGSKRRMEKTAKGEEDKQV